MSKEKSATYTEDYSPDMIRGLSLLVEYEAPKYVKERLDCYRFYQPLHNHPFNLDLPVGKERLARIMYVGGWATDISLEAFLAHIRENTGYTPESIISKLRVIYIRTDKRKHDVYFEFWSGCTTVFSGQTNDDGGAGNEARQSIEDVFAVLSKANNVQIDRVWFGAKGKILHKASFST